VLKRAENGFILIVLGALRQNGEVEEPRAIARIISGF
jgi:hypothetical protein